MAKIPTVYLSHSLSRGVGDGFEEFSTVQEFHALGDDRRYTHFVVLVNTLSGDAYEQVRLAVRLTTTAQEFCLLSPILSQARA